MSWSSDLDFDVGFDRRTFDAWPNTDTATFNYLSFSLTKRGPGSVGPYNTNNFKKRRHINLKPPAFGVALRNEDNASGRCLLGISTYACYGGSWLIRRWIRRRYYFLEEVRSVPPSYIATYPKSLSKFRFSSILKTVKCRHWNGYLVVKTFIKFNLGLSLRTPSKIARQERGIDLIYIAHLLLLQLKGKRWLILPMFIIIRVMIE